MRVIKHEEKPPWTKEVTCSACDSVLEVSEDDLHRSYDEYYVACPICKEIIDIKGIPRYAEVRIKPRLDAARKKSEDSLSRLEYERKEKAEREWRENYSDTT